MPTAVSPFHLHADPMAGLLLANFEKDPDRVYVGFEPQAFDDAVHGQGLLVLGWRVDGRVDVFHDPGLELDPATYGIAGKGMNRMAERSLSDGHFELGPAGAQVDLAFRDLEDRLVRIVVRETDTRPRRPFGLLAPMGSATTSPPALPLVYVHDFYFVRRAGSEVLIEIDGRSHRGDPFPLPLDRARVHFLRYSPDPFIVTWNPNFEGPVNLLQVELDAQGETGTAEDRGVQYELEAREGRLEIRRMSRSEGDHEVQVEFFPAFPDVLVLRDGVEVSGTFRITADPSVGMVRGTWVVERRGGEVHMEAVPAGGWTPGEVPWMARLMFRLVPTFRRWPATYRWTATLILAGREEGPAGRTHLRSAWERTE
ncbi:MAG: hypothetical protein EA352_02100 [Gemmatimonadales bacterium]|nr:MAG: hypothetical protein EA352_02100 [Gemmatimonadales bacterium]